MIWATVSYRSCLCCLYRASQSLAAETITSLISELTIWLCPCVESSLVCWKRMFAMSSVFSWQNSILAFALLHSVLQGQICLLLQVFLDFLLLHSSPLWGTRDQTANIHDHQKSKRVPEKHLLLLYWLCQSLCVDHNKLWKILEELGIPDHLTCLLRNLCAGQEATVRTGHGTTDWFQIWKGVRHGCILSAAYLTYMQSTSWDLLGWMKHNLESRLLREIQQLQIYRWHHIYGRNEEELKSPLIKVKEESGKAGLKLNIQNTKIMASGPIT